MKKIISISTISLIVCAMCVFLLTGATFETRAYKEGDYTYTVSNGEATITGYNGNGGNITIPSILGGYPVMTIGDGVFRNNQGVKGITIPEGIISIGSSAFSWCTNLTSVTIPDSVTSIGDYAFHYCNNLANMIIGDSVKTIGDSAFYACDNLANVVIPNSVISIGDSAFCSCDNLANVVIPDSVISIGDSAFSYCASLDSMIIGDSVETIGELAFYECDNLTSFEVKSCNSYYSSQDSVLFNKDKTMLIQYPTGKIATTYAIPDSVTFIGNYAFYCCNNLTNVEIGDSIETIGDRAFYRCTNLTSIGIPDNVTSIGESAFYNCNKLTSVKIGNSVTSIGNYAFTYCTRLSGVTIPDSVTYIGEWAFARCNITSVTIGNSVTIIGDYAFYNCQGLKSVVIPNCVKTIGNKSFYDCRNLTNVIIGNSVTTIGDKAFSDCNSLKSIVIPDSVEIIGYEAFFDCNRLTSVIIGSGVTTIGEMAFFSCDILTSIEVNNNNSYYSSQDSVLFNKDKTIIVLYLQNKTDTTYTIPDSVEIIGNKAFYDCRNLTNVIIGNSVTTIGDKAFSTCFGLTSITVPDSVTSIGESAFHNCSNLTSIIIPKSVTSVGKDAFRFTGLKTGHVYYGGSKKDFSNIKIGSFNDELLSCANIYYNCTSGGIPLTYADYYKYIAENYPDYLNNPAYQQSLSTCNRHCYDVIEDYGYGQAWWLSYMEGFANGKDILIKEIAGSLGIGQTLEEEWLEKNSLAYAQALASVEPLLAEAWGTTMQSYKDFKFAIGSTEAISKATLISEISKSSPRLSYVEVTKIVNKAYEDADTIGLTKIFTEADRVVDFADVLLYVCQLHQVETEVLNRLLTLIPSDTPLYEGIQNLVADIEKDPVDYVLSKYLSKVAVKEITSLLGKIGKWTHANVFDADISSATLVVSLTSKFLYNYVYQGVKIDALYGAIVSYDFYTTTNIAATDILNQLMLCNINNRKPSEKLLSDYQFIFNARLIALNQYVDSCINIAKDSGTKSLLTNYKEYINEDELFSFENYIDMCRAQLTIDIESGTAECNHGIYNSMTTVSPTCTQKGYSLKACAFCQKTTKGDYTKKSAHIFDNEEDKDCNNCGLVRYIVGELDEKTGLSDTDAKYLLLHTYFPEDYPVSQDCDFDSDGEVTEDDAIYLLFYTFFPTDYPLPEPPFSYVDSIAAVVKEDE